ncbi:hypothetical protein GCM10011491_33070 [Brucella endophytica]|uniref:Uncharacterized protein n=1 Tax=Brucella endophytica TaxID=1963359 RepID=A0A916SKS4_9HYPH|nr:sialidase family protein [Brucella endophytica]GGB02344.1 hypothetical protein GCM10011491_33070 [Brucella endophytica]
MGDTLKWTSASLEAFPDLSWNQGKDGPGSSAVTPAVAATFNSNGDPDKVWCVFRGAGADLSMYAATYTSLPGWQGNWQISGGQLTYESPALTAFPQADPFCVYRGTDNGFYATKSTDGHTWTYHHPPYWNFTGPALATYKGRLWCVYTSYSDKKLYCVSTSNDQDWGISHPLNVETEKATALIAFKGRLWCMYQGAGDVLYVTTSADGVTWSPPASTGQSSDCAPALTWEPSNDALICVYGNTKDKSSFNYMCTTVDDPKNWTAPKPIGNGNLRASGDGAGIAYYNNSIYCVYRGNQ